MERKRQNYFLFFQLSFFVFVFCCFFFLFRNEIEWTREKQKQKTKTQNGQKKERETRDGESPNPKKLQKKKKKKLKMLPKIVSCFQFFKPFFTEHLIDRTGVKTTKFKKKKKRKKKKKMYEKRGHFERKTQQKPNQKRRQGWPFCPLSHHLPVGPAMHFPSCVKTPTRPPHLPEYISLYSVHQSNRLGGHFIMIYPF